MAGPDRRFPFAFVDDLEAPELPPGERHHLERVRRLRAGEPLSVGDGAGSYRLVRFGPRLELAGPVERAPAAATTAIGFALTKGERPELVVQKLVELGIDRIIPFTSDRTVVRWDAEKQARNVERWRVIAREAAAQAHRPHLATIESVTPFAQVATLPGVALTDPDGGALSGEVTTLLVGPEGGFSERESAAVDRHVRLAEHVLRAETAAVAAGVLLRWVNGL